MHGLAAALTVTLNVLLAASPAAGARAPRTPLQTPSRARKLFLLAGVSQKTRLVPPRKYNHPAVSLRLCHSDHNLMAHLDTMCSF